MFFSTFSTVGALVAAVASQNDLHPGDLSRQETYPCWVSIDLLFLQDSTGSFEDDLPNVVAQIPDMIKQVNEQNPNSWFGIANFKDKPFHPLGEEDDYCYRLDGALEKDTVPVEKAYKRIVASGGRDLPEAQYQALISGALDPAVGWRPIDVDIQDGTHAGARVIVMSTDAMPHLPGDVAKAGLTAPPPHPGGFAPNDAHCTTYDYPQVQAAKDALESQKIYLAILTPQDDSVIAAWQWFSETFLGQHADLLQVIKSDSSDLLQGVLKVVKSVTETVCALTTPAPQTTTALPTTTHAPTTVPPTTITTSYTPTTVPTTETPTTHAPTTVPPTTITTTYAPTTVPTTETPTTHAPTTVPPTTITITQAPTTVPTTATPITSGVATTELECPPCPIEPCDCAAVVIKAYQKPHLLHVEYVK